MSRASSCALGLALALATTGLTTTSGTGAGHEQAAAVELAGATLSRAVEPVVEPPEQVTAGRVGDSVELALGPNGHAVGVWSELAGAPGDGQFRLVSSRRTADGTWTEPEEVAEPAHYRPRASLAAVGSDGAVLAWDEWDDDSGTGKVFRSELVDGNWKTPELVGAGGNPNVVANGSVLVMTWAAGDQVKVTTRSVEPASGWSPVRSYPGNSNIVPATGPRGAAVVVWGQYAADGHRLRVLYRGNGADAWDRPKSVPVRLPAQLTSELDSYAVTVDGSGRVVVAWMWRRDVYWTRRTRAGAWSTIATIPGEVGRRGEYGWMWSDGGSRGRLLLVWFSEPDGSHAARYRPRSGFARAQLLSPPGPAMFRGAFGPPLLTGDGVAVVFGVSDPHLAWRWQAPGQSWSSIRTLDKLADFVPPMATAARGRVIATLTAAEAGLVFRQVRVPAR